MGGKITVLELSKSKGNDNLLFRVIRRFEKLRVREIGTILYLSTKEARKSKTVK